MACEIALQRIEQSALALLAAAHVGGDCLAFFAIIPQMVEHIRSGRQAPDSAPIIPA